MTRSWPLVLLTLSLAAGCGGDKVTPPSDVTLAPPPAGQGWQFRTEGYTIPAGSESQKCFFIAVPGAPGADVWVDHFTLAANPGTHHVNIFRVKTIVKLSGQPGDVVEDGECWDSANWSDWPLVMNTQSGGTTVDWQLPAHVGERFQGGDLLMVQVHYVNATTQKTPGLGHVLGNFWLAKQTPTMELGTIFATNQHIRICPGDTHKMFEARCTFPSGGVTLVGANGHFHSRGVEFKISPVDTQGNVGAMFYDSTSWSDPPMVRDLSIPVAAGGGIDYQCSFTAPVGTCGDPQNQCCYTFGGKVETQEHCNAFVYYYPKTEDVNCF